MRWVACLVLVVAAAGCVTPVILEDPASRRRVNCTLEAERLAYDTPSSTTGFDVPWQRPSATLTAFDLQQRCVGNLLREGFVCVAGCAAAPR